MSCGRWVDEEAVVAALDHMVSTGELQPEMAAEILQAILGGGEGGSAPGAEGGAPGGAPGGEVVPREAGDQVTRLRPP